MDSLAEAKTPTRASLCTQANTNAHTYIQNKHVHSQLAAPHYCDTQLVQLPLGCAQKSCVRTNDAETWQRHTLLAYVWTFTHKEAPRHKAIPSLFSITPPVVTPTTSVSPFDS